MRTLLLYRILFIVAVYSCAAWPAKAQPYPNCQVTDYGAEDGMMQEVISQIDQDLRGFIWIGTRNGLYKFDGYSFRNYKAVAHQKHTLSNNRILRLCTTAYGDVWCLTYDNKAFIFDTATEQFYNVLSSVDESRPGNDVRKIFHLANGFAWLVCDDGLCYRIDEKNYQTREGITYSGKVNGNAVNAVFLDEDGDEWLLTDQGIFIYGKKKLECSDTYDYIMYGDDTLYLASKTGHLAYYDKAANKLCGVKIPTRISTINSMGWVANRYLSLSTDQGLILMDGSQHRWQTISVARRAGESDEVTMVYEDRLGELWIFLANEAGIVRYVPTTGEKQHLQLSSASTDTENFGRRLAFEDRQGTLWIVPNKGDFGYFDRERKQLCHFYTDPDDSASLFLPYVRFSFMDRQGNCWLLGSRGMKKLSSYPNAYDLQTYDVHTETRALFKDREKRLWVCSKNKHVRIYRPDGTLLGYLTPDGNISTSTATFQQNVYAICQQKDGTLWLGTRGGGLFRLTPRGGNSGGYQVQRFVHQTDDPYSLSGNDIYSIITDSHDRLWIGCYGEGLNLLDSEAGNIRFINYHNAFRSYPSKNCNRIRCMMETSSGTILVGTTFGLVSFSSDFSNPEKVKFYHNIQDDTVETSLAGNDVMHIFQTSAGDVYLLTYSFGVNKVLSDNLLSNRILFRNYNEQDGLESTFVLSMIEDAQRRLWIVSEKSLTQFSPETGTFSNFNLHFLHKGMNFTEALPALDADDHLVFATDAGVMRVDPRKMVKSDYVPPVVLTELRVNGKRLSADADELEQLSLRPSERNLSVRFAALDYTHPQDIQYAYRLEGLEDEWNYNNDGRVANYLNLPPGDYRLQVKATNSDGVWVDNVRTLPIRVLPTFWETPWAWFVYLALLLLVAGVTAYIFFYIYRLRHQVDMEQELSNIKLRFFTDVSHELRTPLTLIASPVSEVLEDKSISPFVRENLTLVYKNTERMLRLVNQILDFRKIQNNKMKLLVEQTELVSFLAKVGENFQPMADEKHISYTIDAPQGELYGWVDREKVETIVFNLLSNAFKYTLSDKSIRLTIRGEAGNVVISVKDEGIGIASDKLKSLFLRFETLSRSRNLLQPSSGIGLSLVKELVTLHHATIDVESTPGQGSCFRVTIPIARSVYETDAHAELILSDGPAPAADRAEAPLTLNEETDAEDESVRNCADAEDGAEADASKESDKAALKGADAEVADSAEADALKGTDKDALKGVDAEAAAGVDKAELKDAEAVAPDGKDAPDEERQTILIVEDNRELGTFLKRTLSQTYSVLLAPNGEEGLRLATENIPDMILSDVMMPVMDGLEMVRQLKANADTCYIPVILLSAKSALDDRIAALEQGIDDYITKPFSSSLLKLRIATFFQKRKQLQELLMKQLSTAAPAEVGKAEEQQAEVTWEPSQPESYQYDQHFMKQVMEFLEEQMDNSELTIDDFAAHLCLSRSIFYRKLKTIVGVTPVDFVREMRIKRAAQLIESTDYTFSQIAYMTGFTDPKYFSRCFKKVKGVSPSDYKSQLGQVS